jgi:GGDEF domain-containing protein
MNPIPGDLTRAVEKRRWAHVPESFALVFCAWLLNRLVFWDDPGFARALVSPYLIAVLMISGRYGAGAGVLTATLAAVVGCASAGAVHGSALGHLSASAGGLAVSTLYFAAFAVGTVSVKHRTELVRAIDKHERARVRVEVLEREWGLAHEEKGIAEKRVLADEGTFLALVTMFDDLDRLDPSEVPERLLRVAKRVLGSGAPALYAWSSGALVRTLGDPAHWPERIDPAEESILEAAILRKARASVADVPVQDGGRQPGKVLLAAPLPHDEEHRVMVVDLMHFVAFTPERLTALDGCLEIAGRALERARLFASTHDRNVVDPITGACTLAFFEKRLLEEVALARRHRKPLAVLLLADPRLERIESDEERGARLREVAVALQNALRSGDLVAHHTSPGRFAILCPLTPASGIEIVRRRLAEQLAGAHVEVLPIGADDAPGAVVAELRRRGRRAGETAA